MRKHAPVIGLLLVGIVLVGLLAHLFEERAELGQFEMDMGVASLDAAVLQTDGFAAQEQNVELPPRKRGRFEGGAQSKRQWVKRLRLSRRFQRTLCAKRAYLVRCLTPFKDPLTKQLRQFSQRDCVEAVSDIVSREANPGGKVGELQGAFYADDLPATIQAGLEMDVMADRLGFRISQVLLPKLAQRGGKHVDTPYCNALINRAFEVDGN